MINSDDIKVFEDTQILMLRLYTSTVFIPFKDVRSVLCIEKNSSYHTSWDLCISDSNRNYILSYSDRPSSEADALEIMSKINKSNFSKDYITI